MLFKSLLKVNFSDFWPGFDKENNLLVRLLRDKYEVVISDEPEILFYSCYGFEFTRYKCHKIFYTGENIRPNFNECDFALTFDHDDYGGKNFRLPLYVWYGSIEELLIKKDVESIIKSKSKFCCVVVSNPNGKERNQFFEELSRYKKVDSGGSYKNNIGYNVPDKSNFIKDYKFTISFENSSYPGYTTEKIIEPMFVNSIPVYWGNPVISLDFNVNSFVNIPDYKNYDDAINRIIEIDTNLDEYIKILNEPYIPNNHIPYSLKYSGIKGKLFEVIDSFKELTPVSQTYRKYLVVASVYKKRVISEIFNRRYWHC